MCDSTSWNSGSASPGTRIWAVRRRTRVGNRTVEQAAWHHFEPPGYAAELADLIAFSWRAMDGFCEEDEQILGHAPDPYHRIDVRRTSRRLTVRSGGRLVATSSRPVVVYESGLEPCWYVA